MFGLVKGKMSGSGMACNEEIRDESLDERGQCGANRRVLWDGCGGNFVGAVAGRG